MNIKDSIKQKAGKSLATHILNQIKQNESLETGIERYNKLVKQIEYHTGIEIESRLIICKALTEIKENKLYKYGNYKDFNTFINHYKISRTQLYQYLCIGYGINHNIINEMDLKSKALPFYQAEKIIKNNNAYLSFVSERNPTRRPQTNIVFKIVINTKNKDDYNSILEDLKKYGNSISIRFTPNPTRQ